MIGQTVGNYTIRAKIAQGGMGEVYLAEHPRIGRKVAVKMLYPNLSVDRRQVERLFDEALATNLIKHPAIVQIFDCGFHHDRAYLVMEHLEGESLGMALRRMGTFPVGQACARAAQIAAALGAAHDHQIVHRDLKPDNVFLLVSGSDPTALKILDFGVAKLTARGMPSHTENAILLGTPAYMSPEQCRGAHAVDHRTDIYALGCILFEMVVGRGPFVYSVWGEYIAAHQTEQPPAPAGLRPALAGPLDDLILAMLAKQPEDRPQSMREVERRLAAITIPPGEPAATTLRHGVPGRTAPPPVRQPARVVLAAAVATALLIGGAAVWKRKAPPAPEAAGEVRPAPAPLPRPAEAPRVLELRGAPAGSQLWLDGQPATAPLRLSRGGSHLLVVRAPGYQEFERRLGPDETGLLEVTMRPAPAARPSRPRKKAEPAPEPPRRPKPERFRGFEDL